MFGLLRRLGILTGGERQQLQYRFGEDVLAPNGSNISLIPGYMKGETLKRVVPIVLSRQVPGGVLTVIALESYDDGSRITYQAVATESVKFDWSRLERGKRFFDQKWLAKQGSPEDIERFATETAGPFGRQFEIKVEDDQGMKYASFGHGGLSGNGRVDRGAWQFTPPIPDAAQRLSVSVLERVWSWNIDHVSGQLQAEPLLIFEVNPR